LAALTSSPCSPMGTLMPAQNSVPMGFANIPKHARYKKSYPFIAQR
jgi:hypothetical protein